MEFTNMRITIHDADAMVKYKELKDENDRLREIIKKFEAIQAEQDTIINDQNARITELEKRLEEKINDQIINAENHQLQIKAKINENRKDMDDLIAQKKKVEAVIAAQMAVLEGRAPLANIEKTD